MDVSVIIPTYNESDNVPSLFNRLSSAVADTERDYEILVVDDDSPDDTANVARSYASEVGCKVKVIVRTREPDLSRSVVCGMAEARGDVFVVMDADLQHPPEMVPELVSGVTRGTPIAVGTRYANGGSIRNWTFYRRVVSHGARLISQVLVPPARGVSDPVSGFFAVRAADLDYQSLKPNGYKILVELLTVIDPPAVAEVGFTFRDRSNGETGLDVEQYLRFLTHTIDCAVRYRN